MILSKKRFRTSQIAKVANRSERSVTNPRKNMRLFRDARSPPAPVGRQSNIAAIMLDALCDHLAEKPDLYVEEMAIFLRDKFIILPLSSSIKACSFPGLAGLRGKPNRKQKNRTFNYELSTSINYLTRSHGTHVCMTKRRSEAKPTRFRLIMALLFIDYSILTIANLHPLCLLEVYTVDNRSDLLIAEEFCERSIAHS
jgi:hypothetical protein